MEVFKSNFQFFLNCSYLNESFCSKKVKLVQTSMSYSPPDLNKNITEIFGKLINIYRGESDVFSD